MDDYPELDEYVQRVWRSLEKDIESGIFLNATTATSASVNNEPLTLEKMQEMIDQLFPVLYYGTATHIERGVLYYIKETDFNPEYIIFHPDDFEAVQRKITARRLVHVKNEPKEISLQRTLNTMRKAAGIRTPEEIQKIHLENLDDKYQDILSGIIEKKS